MLLTHGYSVKSLRAVYQKKNKIASVSFEVFYSRLKNILARVQRRPNCFREESIGKSTLPQEQVQLECGSMPNVMAALPNIGSLLCSTPQSLANAHY